MTVTIIIVIAAITGILVLADKYDEREYNLRVSRESEAPGLLRLQGLTPLEASDKEALVANPVIGCELKLKLEWSNGAESVIAYWIKDGIYTQVDGRNIAATARAACPTATA